MKRIVMLGKEKWRITGVYSINGDMEKKLIRMREWIKEEGRGIRTLIRERKA